MAFYKKCEICGEIIRFENRMKYPEKCPSCGSKLINYQTYDESIEPIKTQEETPVLYSEQGKATEKDSETEEKKKYYLKLGNGAEISIPEEGGIIGRTELGAEELAEYDSVSRKHLKIFFRRNVGMIIVDISKYGTLVNMQRIKKNEPTIVEPGAIITLCNVDCDLIERGEQRNETG